MALFAPRTFSQIMKDMLARLLASTPLTDVNFGSIWTTMLESAAQEDDEQYFQMFEIIRGYSLDTISGDDLDSRASEFSIERKTASEATSVVTIADTSITKVSTGVYAGLPGPPAGSTSVNGNSATGFGATGSIIIGRGTPNSEIVPYTSITTFPNYVRFNLSAATIKDHGTDETIIMSQGGDRVIAALTVVIVPASDTTEEISYTLDQAATILDGESEVTEVPITAVVAGAAGNVPIGAIQTFGSLPFPSATARNPFRITNGIDDEQDQELRDRIKSTIQSLSRGTGRSITTGILGLVSSEDNKRVVSLSLRDTTDPAEVVKLFIDDGTGFIPSFEHVGVETVVASATGGEKFLQVANFPLVKAFAETQNAEPYNIAASSTLFVDVNGRSEVITFLASDFEVLGAATAQEVLRKINSTALNFEARVSSDGTKVRIFARANSSEEIRVTGGTANAALNFQTDQKFTAKLFLERNRTLTLLSKDGRTAFTESGATGAYDFSSLMHLSIVLDGKVNNIQKVWFDPDDFVTPAAVSVPEAIATILAQAPGITAEKSSNDTRLTLGSLTERSSASKVRVVSDFTHILNEEGGININRTTEMRTNSSNVTIFGTNLDYLYLGHTEVPFDSVFVALSTLASASIAPVFEYWNGTAWTVLGVNDTTNGFSANGHILFQAPYKWATTSVEGVSAFWLRIQRTNAGLVTAPIESRIRICGANEKFLFSDTEAVGANRDYRMNRYVGQIELETPLISGDKVTLGSLETRAFAVSTTGNYNGLVGTTLTVLVDGVSRSCTFLLADFADPSSITPAEVVTAINERMLGVTATTAEFGTRVKIMTNRYNTGTLQVVAGGSNSILIFPTTAFTSFVGHSPALESVQGPWTLPAGANLIVIVDDNFAATFTVPLFSERTLTAATTTVLTDSSLNTTFPVDDDVAGFDALIIDGPQIGERRSIASYVAATGAVTLASALPGAPAIGDKFQIIPTTAVQAAEMLNNKQITLLQTKSEIKASDSGRRLQITSLGTSEDAVIAVSGGTANATLLFGSEARGVDAYRYFIGLAQLVQWTVDGRVDDPETYPGIRAAGVQIEVLEPVTVPIEVTMTVTTQEGVALSSITNNIKSAVSNYINRLAVGADVVRSNIIVAVRGVSGVFDVEVTTPTVNIAIADNELARISDGDISVV